MTLEDILEYKQPTPNHFNFVDKTGVVSGKLNVLFYAGRGTSNKVRWGCSCECGNHCLVLTSNLSPTNQKLSCGCAPKKKQSYLDSATRSEILFKVCGYLTVDSADAKSGSYWTLKCTEGHIFSARWTRVVHEGSRCPYCTKTGTKKVTGGYFYMNAVIDYKDEIIAYKYGVTSKNNSTRIKQVQNLSIYRLENKLFISVDDAELLMSLESNFSKTFGKKYLTKAEMIDGYTETVSAENFETYVFWVNDYLSSKTIKAL